MEESGSAQVLALLTGSALAVSRLSQAEVASAVCRRSHSKEISRLERDRLLSSLRQDFGSLTVVEVVPMVIERSLVLLSRHALRAADAIQLASCLLLQEKLRVPVGFVAFDARLRDAAEAEGLAVLPEIGLVIRR